MKIYVSYRYTGANKESLQTILTNISAKLEGQQHTAFMFFRDGSKWEGREGRIPLKKVMKECFNQIASSDCVLALIQDSNFSEGMLLDIGYALALKKPLIVAKKIGSNFPKTETLATKVIEYSDTTDLMDQLVL